MEEQIFCDGIGRIAIIGGVVRLDLFTFSPTETDANGNPRPVLSHRVVMGTDGFLRSAEKVVEAVQVINRGRPGQPTPQAAAPQPPRPPAPQGQPVPQSGQLQWPPQTIQQNPPPPVQPAPQAPAAPEAPTPARPPFP